MNKKYFFIKPLFFRKNFFLYARKIILTFVLCNIFLIPISSTADEPDDISIFLENLMIREGGIYTLLGSKPMTEFDIIGRLEETEEELAQSYEESKWFLEQVKQGKEGFYSDVKTLPDYEDYKKICIRNRDSLYFLNTKKIWDAWLREKGMFSTSLYKLASREGHYTTGLFIHMPQMVFILKKYQKEFSQITGIQFDVNTILDSIEDKSSVFWDKVFKNHYLHGLLLGFGEKNAYFFNWVREKSLSLDSVSTARFPELSRISQGIEIITKRNITIHDLTLPFFQSFEIYDEEVERYTKEREKIIDFLKDKDFVPFVLSALTAS